MARKKSIDRDRIIDAAEKVVVERGAKALTLDLVAARASISKGGLTYTFATKEALLSAMLDREVARFNSLIERRARKYHGSDYPDLLAIIEAGRCGEVPTQQGIAPILAALMHSPSSLKSVRTFFRALLAKFCSGSIGDRNARIVLMALEGAFLLQGLGLIKLTKSRQAALLDDIASLLSRGTL